MRVVPSALAFSIGKEGNVAEGVTILVPESTDLEAASISADLSIREHEIHLECEILQVRPRLIKARFTGNLPPSLCETDSNVKAILKIVIVDVGMVSNDVEITFVD